MSEDFSMVHFVFIYMKVLQRLSIVKYLRCIGSGVSIEQTGFENKTEF